MDDARYGGDHGEEPSLQEKSEADGALESNRSTLLAYLWTALLLVLSGAAIADILHLRGSGAVGIALLALGLTAALVGVLRYRRMLRSISLIGNRLRSGR